MLNVAVSSVNPNITPNFMVNDTKNTNSSVPYYRGNLDYPPDTVQFKGQEVQEKKGLSKGQKTLIGLSIIGVAVLTIGLLTKGRGRNVEQLKDIEKLYKEKLVKSKLPERIEFKEAKTVEAGIQWTKDTFGIEHIDTNFSLDAINDVNRSLVNISNKHKGDLFIPRALRYKDIDENIGGEFISDILSPDFGTINVNSRLYNENWLNETLRKDLYKSDGITQMFTFDKNNELIKVMPQNDVVLNPKGELAELMNIYYNSPERLTLDGKRALKFSMIRADQDLSYLTRRNPLALLKKLRNRDYVKRNGINIDIAYWEKQPHEKVLTYTKNLLKQMNNSGDVTFVDIILTPAAQPFYHEMGHLQDLGKNWQDLIKTSNGFWNRYGTLRYFEGKNIEELKKTYPAMKEFLENNEIQRTASEVSSYAQEGIGEFVAEMYSDLIWGREFSDEVMALYKRYGGPVVS